jgi:hypothetical protein
MLADTEWTLVTELARDHLLDTVDPHDRLGAYFPAAFVAALPLTARAADNALTLIAAVRGAGMRGDDPPLLRLLEALGAEPELSVLPEARRVGEMLDRERALLALERGRAAASDPFLATVLAGREVFIDRRELRTKLRDLHADDKPTLMLRVTGQPDSGTSHSFRLIEHLAAAYGFRKVPVLLDESGTPEEVIETIALEVAPSTESPPQRQDDPRKWYSRASQWLVKKAKESGGTWWFILDELNHLPPTSEVWDLVQRLAMAVDLYGENRVRLVLLGYDGDLDPKLRNRAESEYFEALSETELREFFTDWFRDLYAAAPPDQRLEGDRLLAQVDDTVTQILAYARSQSAPGGCYMQKLGIAVEEVVRDLAAA